MKLATRKVEKVWGRKDLPAPFSTQFEEPVGEIWFEPPAEFDQLLIKYLFTSEKLSVQVHPAEGQAGEGVAGKDECWLVLNAEPGAKLAIGFREPISQEQMRAAALDGSIEELLEWHEAKAGDFFYLPANTVHAIGPGLALVEVQQNTDITYRLYDYGRPRELHLDEALAVADGGPYAENNRSVVDPETSRALVDGSYFVLDQVVGQPGDALTVRHQGPLLVLPLEGSVSVSGERIDPGDCGLAQSLDDVVFEGEGRTLLASAVNR